MSNETSEVTALIRALRDGSLSLKEVADRFRNRTWPATNPPAPNSYLEMAKQVLEDPRPDVPNSYDDVVAAYDRGELTDEQFDVLSQAVADANNAEPQGND